MMKKQTLNFIIRKKLKIVKNEFMRQRNILEENEVPVMCTVCMGFYSKSFKACHQLNCAGSGTNVMIPMILINSPDLEKDCDNVKELLKHYRKIALVII